jgi:cytochrome P450
MSDAGERETRGPDMQAHTTTHDETSGLDISSAAFWALPFDERDRTFATLRDAHPVSWHPPIETPEYPDGSHGQAGFWAVTRAEDITYVSQHHEVFSSAIGLTGLRPIPEGARAPLSFLEMDPPTHTAYRKVMSASFTPKAVARLGEKIEERAAAIVDRVAGAGEIDFVTEVAARLPMMTIADLVGVPESLMETFADAGDEIVKLQDPSEYAADADKMALFHESVAVLAGIGAELARARRVDPQDDIMTALVSVEVDGRKLDEQEILMILVLLSVAGNDTTKQTTTRTVIQFDRHPEQRSWLLEDFDGRIMGSIDEFIRHASPVLTFARTATVDVELHGQSIRAGDKVGMFYCSGNRDDRVFERAADFDLDRPRSPHVGFGGGGVHYCLGNGVAKAQLRALFRQILTRLPRLEVGEPDYLVSDFINGVKHLPVTIR